MITRDLITPIGRTIKPHGINGEIATAIDSEIDPEALKCLIIEIDGIFVPFFINATRPRGAESVLLSIDGISNEREAKAICPKTVYALKCDVGDISGNGQPDSDDGFYAEDLIGFQVTADGNDIGEITDIDNTTDNFLFIITPANGKKRYIPVADEFINEVNPDSRTIDMSLPEGLLDL